MRLSKHLPGTRRVRIRTAAVAALAALLLAAPAVVLVGTAQAAPTAVRLGTAGSFAVLAGSGITNTGVTTINGDVGSYPNPSETGFTPCPAADCVALTGTNHGGDGVTQGAKTDLTTAYNTAASEGPTSPISTLGGGQTLTPGVYNSASSIGLTGALTLDGGGDSNAVFVFQAGSALTTASASTVILTNGAQACNVFWQVGSSATLGSSSTFQGTILAFDDISLDDSVTVDGRLLGGEQASGAGAVTLIHDTITTPTCSTVTTTTTAPTATTTAPTATTTAPTATTTAPTATTTARTSSQLSATPRGAPQTGGGSMAGVQDVGLFGVGGVLLLAGAGVLAYRRRRLPR